MNTSTLEARLAALEAESAVAKRMSAYLRSCDTIKTPEAIGSHFTDDGIWEGIGRNTEFGKAVGSTAVGELFRAVPTRQPFTVHYLTNAEIEVAGHTATGRWLCFEPSTIRGGTMPVWIGLSYHNDFRKVGDLWLISHLRCDTLFATPYDTGWGKEMFTQVTAPAPESV
nr:nuclear transport factor 2 family protein [uncultured Rhodococcus sp.]